MKRTIRVFPRRTSATPDDELVVINDEPGLFHEADEVHISVTFTWDLPQAERLAKAWECVAPVKIGGPATGERSEGFTPGMYIKKGYIITSRGCPNQCWFCSVWRREGSQIRELQVSEGWNVLDDNLLACSDEHIRRVFSMLKKQKMRRAEFTGGFEAKRLKQWHVDLLADLKPAQVFFAYDTPDDLEPLIEAGKLLQGVGLKIKHPLRAYVLCGYARDTMDAAEKRMYQTIDAGFLPMAMLYRDRDGNRDKEWMRWQRNWARPAIMAKAVNA